MVQILYIIEHLGMREILKALTIPSGFPTNGESFRARRNSAVYWIVGLRTSTTASVTAGLAVATIGSTSTSSIADSQIRKSGKKMLWRRVIGTTKD
jgi:hypothetical protein